jgi:hypothetical protein
MMKTLIRSRTETPWKQAFFSAILVWSQSSALQADAYPFFPLSTPESGNVPLIERKSSPDASQLQLSEGVTRRGDQYALPAGSRILVLQKAREELRFQWPAGTEKVLHFGERSGPLMVAMDTPSAVSGAAKISAPDRDRWIEIGAHGPAKVHIHAIRHEEVGARLEDELRPLSLSGEDVLITRQDGAEEKFFRIKTETVLNIKRPTLLKIQSRAALSLLRPDHRPYCLVTYQKDKEAERFVQSSSPAAPYESGSLNGEKIGLGAASSFYLVIPDAQELTLASNCLLSVQGLVMDEGTRVLTSENQPELFSAWTRSRLRPLDTWLQLSAIPRQMEHYRSFQALRLHVGANELFYKALYPEDLDSQESVARVRGILRREIPEGTSPKTLIPEAFQSDCLCVRSSVNRRILTFDNPMKGRETLGRLVLPEAQELRAAVFQLRFKNEAGKTVKSWDAHVKANSSGDSFLLASVTFPIPADAKTIAIARDGNAARLPELGLEILSEREAGLDQATVLQQLRDPQKGYIAFMMNGRTQDLSREQQRMLMPARQSLQRHASRLRNLTRSSLSFQADALREARRSMMEAGSYYALRNICLGSLAQKGAVRKEAFQCLREVFRKTEDYRSLAVILNWQYGQGPTHKLISDYADALSQAGFQAEALMLLAESSQVSEIGKETLKRQLSQLSDPLFLLQANSLPLVSRYPEAISLQDLVTQEARQAFTLDKNQSINLESDASDGETYELEWRTRADSSKHSGLHWIQVTRGPQSQIVPLLLEGKSGEMKDPRHGELSYPARFLVQVKKGQPIILKGLGGPLYLRIKRSRNQQLPKNSDDLVHLFPGDPKDSKSVAAFSKIGSLEQAGRFDESMSLRAERMAEIRKEKPLSWPSLQQLRILESGTRWIPLPSESEAAQLMREEFTAWSPDHPTMVAQKKLLPKFEDDVITVVGSEEEDFTELELAAEATLRLQFKLLALDESGRSPQDIEMKVDALPWQSFTMKGQDFTRSLQLGAGHHQLGFRFKEKGGSRYLALRIAAQVDGRWNQLKLKKAKYWAVPTAEQPLLLKSAGLYRIHRRSKDLVDIKYQALKRGETLRLPSTDHAAYRLYVLALDEDRRPKREPSIRLASLVAEETEPNLVLPQATRPVYSLSDKAALSLALGTRSNCRDEGDGKQGFCEDAWHPKLAMTLSQRKEASQIFGRLSVFPGTLPLGQFTAGWDLNSPSRAMTYEFEAQAFFADNAGESLQGGGGSLGVFYKASLGAIDSQTGIRLNAFEANRDRIHPDLPQEVVSQWKVEHRRTLWLSQSLEYKPGVTDSFRLNLAVTSNPPNQSKAWDQAAVVASWLRAWTPLLSTGLGYEARYYFRDERRSDYLLRYSPRFSLVGLNYDALQWPILTRIQIGLEPDSPRTVFALSLETPLGTRLNPDAASLRNFPFSDQGRGEIFKRHVQ